jgi:hypothetical protein
MEWVLAVENERNWGKELSHCHESHVKPTGAAHEATLLGAVVLVRKRTIPTERPQPVGEVSVEWSAQRIPTVVISVF